LRYEGRKNFVLLFLLMFIEKFGIYKLTILPI